MSATGISDRDRLVIPIVNAWMYLWFAAHHYFSDAWSGYSTRINKHTYFILWSLCAKTIITWLAFTSLKHIVETIEPEYIEYNIDWEESFNIILYVIISFVVVVGGFMYTVRPYDETQRTIQKGSASRSLLPPKKRSEPEQDEDVLEIACQNGVPLMGRNIPMLGPESYTIECNETDSLL